MGVGLGRGAAGFVGAADVAARGAACRRADGVLRGWVHGEFVIVGLELDEITRELGGEFDGVGRGRGSGRLMLMVMLMLLGRRDNRKTGTRGE